MKKLNVIIVFDKDEENILMCKRSKEPYKGLFNLVGGKVEENESEYICKCDGSAGYDRIEDTCRQIFCAFKLKDRGYAGKRAA